MKIDTNDIRLYDVDRIHERLTERGVDVDRGTVLVVIATMSQWMQSEERQEWKDEMLLAEYRRWQGE